MKATTELQVMPIGSGAPVRQEITHAAELLQEYDFIVEAHASGTKLRWTFVGLLRSCLTQNLTYTWYLAGSGLRCDQTIALTAPKGCKDYPQPLRRITFYAAEHGKSLVFLTHNFDLPAPTIAQLYRCRGQSLPPRRRGSNYFSNGSNSIFGSSGSTAPPKMRSRHK